MFAQIGAESMSNHRKKFGDFHISPTFLPVQASYIPVIPARSAWKVFRVYILVRSAGKIFVVSLRNDSKT